MYDASFDQTGSVLPALDRRLLWVLRIAAVLGLLLSGTLGAQLPGAPVLQNAWATPGFVAAANFAGGSDGSVWAGAVGWTPGSGRFQVSGGLGVRNRTGYQAKPAYGARVAMPFGGASSTFGFAAFAGVGGSQVGAKTGASTTTAADSAISTTEIPLGAAIGWRRAIGSNHGISVYGTPAYILFSGGNGGSGGVLRVGLGADVGITNSIGATVGVDFGQSRPRAAGGPASSLYGVGLSYAFGRR